MIKDAIKIAKIHIERLKAAEQEIRAFKSLDDLNLDNFEVVKTIDTFIFRFMKLQDYMGNKLFKVFLMEIGDYRDDMSFIDMLDKLEKLRIINSAEDWMKIRKLRNKLAHEYPDEIDEILEDIKEALNWIDYLENAFQNIVKYLIQRDIFPGIPEEKF